MFKAVINFVLNILDMPTIDDVQKADKLIKGAKTGKVSHVKAIGFVVFLVAMPIIAWAIFFWLYL